MPKRREIIPYFDLEKVTREELVHIARMYYPHGSGPLSTMRVICRLIVNIAELKGFEPLTHEEINGNKVDREFYDKNPDKTAILKDW